MYKGLLIIGVIFSISLVSFLYYRELPPAHDSQDAGVQAEEMESDSSGSTTSGASSEDGDEPDGRDPAPSIHELRMQAVASHEPWSPEFRARLHALPPSELLEFLDDDRVLEHDDARDLVNKIYSLCGVSLGLMVARESIEAPPQATEAFGVLDDPGADWCWRMVGENPPRHVKERVAELLEITTTVDPTGTPRRQMAREQLEQAKSGGPREIVDLLDSENVLTVTMAVEELWQQREREFMDDWTGVQSLSESQRYQVFEALHTSLECSQLGDCGTDGLPVSSLCLQPEFQCDDEPGLDGVLYRSLSPSQLDVYHALLTAIARYRQG